MTGAEYEKAIKAAGFTQGSFAKVMGVHRTTVAARCETVKVEPVWVYALAGVIAGIAMRQVVDIVANADI